MPGVRLQTTVSAVPVLISTRSRVLSFRLSTDSTGDWRTAGPGDDRQVGRSRSAQLPVEKRLGVADAEAGGRAQVASWVDWDRELEV